jgi:exonuclease SbcC
MINSIELGNFLSHSDTQLNFDNGVTIFVGDNGAGKSSIIDAITFALFGKHTRGEKKGIVKRGTNQSYVKLNFNIAGKQYQAERKYDKGTLSALFSEKINGKWVQMAAGERKQYGESMTAEIEKKIGLTYDKLKIASIVQQGELSSIIESGPSKFKELLNSIIRIDKLDVAYHSMNNIKNDFREKIREKVGDDHEHLEYLEKKFGNYKIVLSQSKTQKDQLDEKNEKLEEEIAKLKKQEESESSKIEKLSQLDDKRQELISYAKEAIEDIRNEIAENEAKIQSCEPCFEYFGERDDVEKKLKSTESAKYESEQKLLGLFSNKSSLLEKESLAKKLQLKDNKCPVCDSKVDKLTPLFQVEHLKQELQNVQKQIDEEENKKERCLKKNKEFSEKLEKAKEAETTLKAHSIKNKDDLVKIKNVIKIQKTKIQKIPSALIHENLVEIVSLGPIAKRLVNSISKLQEETKGFDKLEFSKLKTLIIQKQNENLEIISKLGAINGKINDSEEEIRHLELLISQLKIVKDYVSELDEIRKNIFNRDGPVATSMRSWALNTISAKASEYLSLLNTKIQRISLSEKKDITCYSKNEKLDLKSLSGGEKVCVSLAMILDEPTTHLDAKRKKELVNVLSQLSNISNKIIPMQFIIITHDSEIFENSNVENIFKFESTLQGTKVTEL